MQIKERLHNDAVVVEEEGAVFGGRRATFDEVFIPVSNTSNTQAQVFQILNYSKQFTTTAIESVHFHSYVPVFALRI